MASKKITDMPNWGGNQVPTDLLTGVDLSATVANQNVRSTLNDLFSVITKNITDGAVRWQGVAAPAVSAAGAGSIYFSTADNIYYASENGAAYVPLITKPAGSNKQVQFNNSAAFGGAAGFEYQAAASPNVQITAQNAAYTALQIDSAATPSAPIVKIRNTTADLYDFNVSDLTITKTTAFSIWLKTNAGAASSFRVGANSGTHPGSAYGLLFPYVGGSNSDGPGIYWTDGTYGSTVRLNLNLGLNFQGSSGVNAFRIRKATDNLNDGDLIFDFRPNDANFSMHPWGTNPGETTPIIFRELVANGTNYVGFKAPDAITNDCVWVLPAADGSSGQALTTNGSKVLSWTTVSGGSVAGSNKQVQFNNSAAFGGAAGFEYQAAASPNVSITAQNAAYVPLFVNTASTPSASIQQWAINNTVAVEIDKDGYLYLGRGITSATPQTGKIFATGGSGSNVAGGSLILYGGIGTGTGQGGSIAFYTSPAGASGSTPNTLVVYGELDQLGNWFLGDTNALLATSATNGFLYCQATNGIPAGTPAATWTGIMPITIDATNYRLYSYIGGAWRNLTGSGGSPGGTSGQIQFNNSSAFGGAAGFTYQSGASPNVTITAQNASHVGLHVNSAATPSADVLQVSADNGTTTHFKVTSTGAPSAPGSGATTERYGSGSSTGTSTTAISIGNSKLGAGTGSVLITMAGLDYSAKTLNNDIFIKGTTSGTPGQAVAIGGNVDSDYGVALGISTMVGGGGGSGGVAIGHGASHGNAVATIDSVAIGRAASVDSSYSVGIGASVSIPNGNANTFVSGSSSQAISNVFFGKGITNATPTAYTINGTGGSGTNIAGANLNLAAGRGTGTGIPGTIGMQFARAGSSGSSLNTLSDEWRGSYSATDTVSLTANIQTSTTALTEAARISALWATATHASRTAKLQFQLVGNAAALATVAEFDMDTSAGNTRFLIYDVDNATLERVSVGAPDSGGTGFKVLRIPN